MNHDRFMVMCKAIKDKHGHAEDLVRDVVEPPIGERQEQQPCDCERGQEPMDGGITMMDVLARYSRSSSDMAPS